MADELDEHGGSPAGRRRGGQPGNLNAFKHGFYSRQFRLGEATDLDEVKKPGLENEIDMLRVVTRRLFALAGDCEDPEELATVLNALGMASGRLGGLIRTQWLISGMADQTEDELAEALSKLYEEKGLS